MRATPKTQSALLEAMEERQVTVDGVTYPLPKPFMVMATQNPIEYEGTFPLPEAQLDRFLMRIRLGYPQLTDEINILELQQIRHHIEGIGIVPVWKICWLFRSQPNIFMFLLQSSDTSLNWFGLPGNIRMSILAQAPGEPWAVPAGQVRAAIMGRDFVLPDDIKYLAPLILGHRIVVQPASRLRKPDPDKLLQKSLVTCQFLLWKFQKSNRSRESMTIRSTFWVLLGLLAASFWRVTSRAHLFTTALHTSCCLYYYLV